MASTTVAAAIATAVIFVPVLLFLVFIWFLFF